MAGGVINRGGGTATLWLYSNLSTPSACLEVTVTVARIRGAAVTPVGHRLGLRRHDPEGLRAASTHRT